MPDSLLDGRIIDVLEAIELARLEFQQEREVMQTVGDPEPDGERSTRWQARMDTLEAITRILRGAGLLVGGCRDLLKDAPATG